MSGKKSFSKRLLKRVVWLTAGLFAFATLVASLSSHFILADEATTSARNLLDASISDMERVLGSVEASVNSSAWMVNEHSNDTSFLYHMTEKIVSENENIVGSAVAFIPDYFEDKHYFAPYSYIDINTSEVKSKQLGNDKYDYFSMDWYQNPSKYRKPSWSEPYFDEGGGGYTMSTYSTPLIDSEGNVYAVLTADISLKWFSDYVAGIKPYPSSYITLASKLGAYVNVDENNILIGQDIFSTGEKVKDPRALDLAYAMVNGDNGTIRFSNGSEISFAVFGPLSNGWSAAVICRYDEVLKRASILNWVLLLIGLVGILALFFASKKLIGNITKPLSEFSNSAKSIATGNFNTQLPEISSEDEISQLRDSFDAMQKSLTTYMEDLKVSVSANERLESELDIARKIQMSMLPKDFPNGDGLDFHAVLVPAKEVGGDLYDFYKTGNTLNVLIGDVSGKGVPAAIVMGMTMQAFRLLWHTNLSPAEMVREVNDRMSEGNTSNMFVTLFLARIDLTTGEMTYCNAGHNPVLVTRPGQKPEFLEQESNLVLGIYGGYEYKEQKVSFEKGTRLLLYTDGVTEAENKAKDQFGNDRLEKWAEDPAREKEVCSMACGNMLSSLRAFTDGNDQSDDITVMTIKIS